MRHGRIRTSTAALIAAFALSACGGGGGSSNSLPIVSQTSTPGPSSSQAGKAAFSIVVPPAMPSSSASLRKPQYISPNTGSIRIAVLSVDGASEQVPDTTARIAFGAPSCSTDKTQPLQCTVTAAAPIGDTVAFRISTYASADASGSVLATTTLSAPVSASGNTAIPLSLGGVVDHVAISPKRFVAPTDGKLQTYLVSVTPVDASGATIVGSGAFASPIHLAIQNDPSGALTLTRTELTSPSDTVQVKFDSSKALSDAKIFASTGSSGTLEADFVTLDYSPNDPVVQLSGSPVTVAVSEAGFTGQFTLSVADPTVATASISPTSSGAATITISPPAPGSYDGRTTMTLSDGTTSAVVPIKVIYPLLQVKDWQVGGGPVALAPSSDGQSYFFADPGLERVVQFFPKDGSMLTVDQNMPDAAVNMALGPDGNPWWVISGWPQAQLCTGAFFRGTYQDTCYNLTGSYSQANSWGLVAGTNNTLWMTLYTGSQGAIASFNITSGTFTYYSNGIDASANPYRIAYGSDGNVWFTDQSATRPAIGKLNTSTGTITEYPLPTGDGSFGSYSVPDTILSGPDGNLWFTDNSQNNPAIGKVIPSSGAVTEYRTGLQRVSQPVGMTIGPDGKIWFSDSPGLPGGEYLIGTIDASTGAIQEYSLSIPGFSVDPLITVNGKLEVMDSFGIVGQPYGAFAGEITLPTTTSTPTLRRGTAAP